MESKKNWGEKDMVQVFPLVFKAGRLTSLQSQWKEVSGYNMP